jgi:OFA family oxalate/formate antiporter-like MFS transporter
LYGTGVGLTVKFKQYTTPLMISWSHFPEHKGRITGIILAAFGLSASIFNLISTHMINPENKKPEDKYDGVKYFDADVAYRYPPTMRWLSLIYLIITLPGLALLVRPQKTQETNEKANLKQGLKSKNFWIMFTIGFLSVIPGFFLANTYKILGEKMIDDDNFLAIVGSVSSFANGSFRFFWGQLLDKIGFKKTYFLLLTLQSSLIVTLFYVAKVKALYLIWVSLILACEGGHFSVFPATLAKMFGKKLGSKLVGIIYYGFSAGAVMGYVLNITVLEDFGYQVLFWIMGVMGVASFVGSRFLSDENDYEENEKSFIGDGGLIN